MYSIHTSTYWFVFGMYWTTYSVCIDLYHIQYMQIYITSNTCKYVMWYTPIQQTIHTNTYQPIHANTCQYIPILQSIHTNTANNTYQYLPIPTNQYIPILANTYQYCQQYIPLHSNTYQSIHINTDRTFSILANTSPSPPIPATQVFAELRALRRHRSRICFLIRFVVRQFFLVLVQPIFSHLLEFAERWLCEWSFMIWSLKAARLPAGNSPLGILSHFQTQPWRA